MYSVIYIFSYYGTNTYGKLLSWGIVYIYFDKNSGLGII